MDTPRSLTLVLAATMIVSTVPAGAGLRAEDPLGLAPVDEPAMGAIEPNSEDALEANLLEKLDDGPRAVIVQFDDEVPTPVPKAIEEERVR